MNSTVYNVIESIGASYLPVTGLRLAAIALSEMPLWLELNPDQRMAVNAIVREMRLWDEDSALISRQMTVITDTVLPSRCGPDVKNALSSLRSAMQYEADARAKAAIAAQVSDKAALDGVFGEAFIPFELRPALIRRVFGIEAEAAHAENS